MAGRTEPAIALVVAVGRNGVIGRAGTLPWHVPSDLKTFRDLTMGKPVIMGRRTYDSIGRPLAGRDNIVVTGQAAWSHPGVETFGSLEAALRRAHALAAARGVDEIMVIGGAQIFNAVMPKADRIYLTRIQAAPDGDTFFPELDPADWHEVRQVPIVPDVRDSAPARLYIYERATREWPAA